MRKTPNGKRSLRSVIGEPGYVEIIVGKEKQSFTVLREVVCQQSDYFRSALKNTVRFKKTVVDRRIALSDADPNTFRTFLHWAMTEKLVLDGDKDHVDADNIEEAVDVYMFGEKYTSRGLRQAILDMIVAHAHWSSRLPSFTLANRVFASLPESDLLHRFFRDLFVYCYNPSKVDISELTALRSLPDHVFARLMEKRNKYAWAGKSLHATTWPWIREFCQYHEHEEGEDRAACSEKVAKMVSKGFEKEPIEDNETSVGGGSSSVS